MAEIHEAEISPTKDEVVASWLGEEADAIERIAAYRFDDPDGEVGMEVHIVRTGAGALTQVPLVYRGAELDEAGPDDLVALMDHSVLGKRWIYDATADPVFATELARVIAEADVGAEQISIASDGTQTPIVDGVAQVRGTGELPAPSEGGDEVPGMLGMEIVEELDLAGLSDAEADSPGQLVGTWAGQERPVRLARTFWVTEDELA